MGQQIERHYPFPQQHCQENAKGGADSRLVDIAPGKTPVSSLPRESHGGAHPRQAAGKGPQALGRRADLAHPADADRDADPHVDAHTYGHAHRARVGHAHNDPGDHADVDAGDHTHHHPGIDRDARAHGDTAGLDTIAGRDSDHSNHKHRRIGCIRLALCRNRIE